MCTAKQHSRKRNIIVTGLNVHSYAHAATRTRSTRGSTQTDGEDVSESNEMCKNVIVQLLSVDKKTDLMRKKKCLKGSNFYLHTGCRMSFVLRTGNACSCCVEGTCCETGPLVGI